MSCLHPLVVCSLLVATSTLSGADSPIDFERQIQPLLATHCLSCHGPEKQRSGFRVDRRRPMLEGGDFGEPAVVPGKPAMSPLLARVRGEDTDLRMPPEGDLLDVVEIELISRWIAEGAQGLIAEEEKQHWAFQPVVRPALPATESNWPRNAIDQFVWQRLQQHQLGPSADAGPETLIRRLTQDVTGLLPTPQEVESFLEQPMDNDSRYQAAVDRLLGSPRYGERWAQHWLDVIRWAETVGFETNLPRPNAWHYRDWVIRAFNEDLPYDQFIRRQLAGDTVADDAALGFLVAGPANLPGQIGRDEEAMRQARQDELDEVIRTVSQSVFGITIGCARCHNHKFDPILQRDYYSMQSIFAGLAYGERRLRGPLNDAWTQEVPAAQKQIQRLREELEKQRKLLGLRAAVGDIHTDSFPPVKATAMRMEIASTGNGQAASLYEVEVWTTPGSEMPSENVALASAGGRPSASSFALENQTRHHDNLVDGTVDKRQAFPWVASESGPAWIQIEFADSYEVDRVVWHRGRTTPADYRLEVKTAGGWQTVASSRDRLPRIDDSRGAEDVKLQGASEVQIQTVVALLKSIRAAQGEHAKLSNGPRVYAASFSTPAPTWLLRRGDPMQRGQQVDPSPPAFLGGKSLPPDAPEATRRLELVEHLTSGSHPLTARVIVNRLWQHHFGAGLVDTPSDFGRMGELPSHPELLDWLAAELIDSEWSLKHVQRLILCSRTYRQASAPRPEAARVDAAARFLWRFPPRRLSAEVIRDSILQVSGNLNLRMGDAGFDFFNQRGGLSDYSPKETFDARGWRRMVYAHKIRMQAVDIFGAFDCPDAGQMKPKRTRSITPVQSLSLLNSPFTNRQAMFFAQRVIEDVGASEEGQVVHAFRLALGRRPNAEERSRLADLAREHGLDQACRVLLNTGEFLFIR